MSLGEQIEMLQQEDGSLNRITERWQMTDFSGERIFIMYGDEAGVRRTADRLGYINVKRSGHYSYKTNTIVGALDGPTTYDDRRRSGF